MDSFTFPLQLKQSYTRPPILRNIIESFPQEYIEKIKVLNLVNTYVLVIENKDKYIKIKEYLEYSGFSKFDLKIEDEMYTLTFQFNGFNFKENMMDTMPMPMMDMPMPMMDMNLMVELEKLKKELDIELPNY